MRYLVLSDIHANVTALEAVLQHASGHEYDEIIVLGDLVGYGPDPNEVVARVRGLKPIAIIRGNHDKVAAGLEGAEGFNPTAQRAAAWTRAALTEEHRDYLAALPRGPIAVDDQVEICHGSPFDEDAYIFGEGDLAEALAFGRRPLCLFGHTHTPTAAVLLETRELDVLFHGAGDRRVVTLEGNRRYMVNPGSVGQPRDGDRRAAYAVADLDQRTVTIERVEYAVEEVSARVLASGLPKPLADRLLVGR
jgi:predicted phosphodiesterase